MSGGQLHLFGVRHHGPGSARNVRAALQRLKPDLVLIEGPPEADDLLSLAGLPSMQPPIALLIYDPNLPQRAAFYPFATFSPEWQAIQHALQTQTPVQFIDLPQAYQFAQEAEADAGDSPQNEPPADDMGVEADSVHQTVSVTLEQDPLGELAQAAGFEDGEAWWEQMVEQRQDDRHLFEAILLAMTALREESEGQVSAQCLRREAYMRQRIRQALRDGFTTIAVVCGAWHAPALVEEAMPTAKADKALLKGLKKSKVATTWIPWSYNRLTKFSGYGAGIWSPGWYEHLWSYPDDPAPRWLTKVAHLLREESLDASPAQVIDAVNFANTLATLRHRAYPSLVELNEAVLTTFCHGYETPMQLIHERLIVSNRLGQVPPETPTVPLQQHFQQEQKRLRMRADASESVLKLDLRKPMHLSRSHLLHRLILLEINWGHQEDASKQLGTFNEIWRLCWYPELALQLIEKNVWGNTIQDAAYAYCLHLADTAPDLRHLTQLIQRLLLADLSQAINDVVQKLEAKAALTSDINQLMAGLPPLAEVLVYGDVRQTDVSMLDTVVNGVVTRVCVGLPLACASLSDEAAQELLEQVIRFQQAIRVMRRPDHETMWYHGLKQISQQQGAHGLLRGRTARILFDHQQADIAEVMRWMRLAVSLANEPSQAAAWLTGFLKDSGLVLLHNAPLLQIINEWVMSLSADAFTALLPLLRRIFTTFTPPERKQIGRLIAKQQSGQAVTSASTNVEPLTHVDPQRANRVLPVLADLLGLTYQPEGSHDDQS